MMTNKQHFWKSITLFVFTLIFLLFLFTNCLTEIAEVTEPKLTILNEEIIVFEKDAGSKTIEVSCNRDWKISLGTEIEWIAVSPKSGKEGSATLTIKVKSNNSEAREGFFTVVAGDIEKTITITQEGEDVSSIVYTTIQEIRSKYKEKGQDEWAIAEPLSLKGVVISDRIGANRPSQRDGFIQDEAGNGLAFRVTQSIHSYDMGDELSINLEGATLLYYGGILQLNFSNKTAKVESQNVAVIPKELTIEEIQNGDYDATLVKIKDVQFKSFKGLSYYEKGIATNRTLENCDDANIIVKTTKYASFKDELLPAGNGNVVGIVSQNNGEWQLLIRNLEDVKEMSNDELTRCAFPEPPVEAIKISIANFRTAISDTEIYTNESYIEGEIILNSYEKNVPDNIVYLADETAGIALTFSDKENILTNAPIGAKVKVNVKGAKVKVQNGLLLIGDDKSLNTQNVEIVEKTSMTPLKPKVATINEILDGKYQSELVKIENVQFKDIEAKYYDSPFVIDEAKREVLVFTERKAAFANETVMKGMGSIVAVVSVYNSPQLLIRSLKDISDMIGDRFVDPFIIIEENAINLAQEGGDKTIKITANVDWTASSDKSWLKITPTAGSNNGTITVTATENEGAERSANITITNGEITETIVVSQKAKVVKHITIKELCSMYMKSGLYEWTIAEPLRLKGVVISDRIGGNRPSQRDGFIQDEDGNGLSFRVSQSIHSYDMGDELSINLEGATLLYYGGILQLNFSNKTAKVESQNVAVIPKELTIEEIQNGDYDATLVKIKDVQFKSFKGLSYYEKGIATNRTLENCDDSNIIVKTTKYASFKDELLPAGNGNVVGIVSQNNGEWQLLIRNLDDVKEMSNDELTRCVSIITDFIITDKDAVTFKAAGEQQTISITANVDWTASSDKSWLTIAPKGGSNDGAITITASKNDGAERTAIITITDGTINKAILVKQNAKEASKNAAKDLFFSEYVMGKSYNKYLEVFNGTGATIDLSDYKIELYVNGQSVAKSALVLSGTLEHGKVVVYKNSKAKIYDGEATASSVINFNGNDAIALIKISTGAFVDIFGCIGRDPGKAWTTDVFSGYDYVATKDRTLVRKQSVRSGLTKNPKKDFPTLRHEWTSYPIDTSEYLGWHTMD